MTMLRTLLALSTLLCLVRPLSAGVPFHDLGTYFPAETDNIVYGTAPVNNPPSSLESLTLDLYQPTFIGTPVPANAPAVVLIHGGGFVGGDKADMREIAQEYTSLGYTVVSINYRMYLDLPPNSSPGPADNFTDPGPPYESFPDLQLGGNAINAAVQDAETAMTWVRSNAATLNIDPNRIGIGGASAGGITSLLVGYNDSPAHVAPHSRPRFPRQHVRNRGRDSRWRPTGVHLSWKCRHDGAVRRRSGRGRSAHGRRRLSRVLRRARFGPSSQRYHCQYDIWKCNADPAQCRLFSQPSAGARAIELCDGRYGLPGHAGFGSAHYAAAARLKRGAFCYGCGRDNFSR